MAVLDGSLPPGFKNAEEYFAHQRARRKEQDSGIYREGLELVGRDPFRPLDGVTYIDDRDRGTFTYATWTPDNRWTTEGYTHGTLGLKFRIGDFERLRGDLSKLKFPVRPYVRVIVPKENLEVVGAAGETFYIVGRDTLFREVRKLERLSQKFGISYDYDGLEVKDSKLLVHVGKVSFTPKSREKVKASRLKFGIVEAITL